MPRGFGIGPQQGQGYRVQTFIVPDVNGMPPDGVSSVRITEIKHAEGPDGSLYATVNKRQIETKSSTTSTSSTSFMQNGTPVQMQNGTLNGSKDSGISSTSGTINAC